MQKYTTEHCAIAAFTMLQYQITRTSDFDESRSDQILMDISTIFISFSLICLFLLPSPIWPIILLVGRQTLLYLSIYPFSCLLHS